MKLERWVLISEVVGTVAVVATLVVLITESRRNTQAIRASTYQAVVDSITVPLDMRASDPEMTRIWGSGMAGDKLGDNDQARFDAMLLAAVRRFENAYYQYRLETLDQQQWDVLRGQIRGIVSSPGSKDWWEQSKARFSPDFRRELETVR